VEKVENKKWVVCQSCKGNGKRKKSIRKKTRLNYQAALAQYEKTNCEGNAPIPPKGQIYTCLECKGSGLVGSDNHPLTDNENYPHVAIIGGGIGGIALAVACLHRGIPFTLYERDSGFEARSQGYALTLQQASKALNGFGILSLKEGVTSTRHVVHTTDGKIIGEWGIRKWGRSDLKDSPKRKQLNEHDSIKWGHQLLDLKKSEEGVTLNFQVNNEIKSTKADLVVGADGIRSTVRKLLIGEDITPLRYLGCIVILGICPLDNLKNIESSLLDSATVFQTANGNERIYLMPYDEETLMWQLSFPLSVKEAKELSAKGVKALKKEAVKRTQWHDPIPQILEATLETQISGYPVYDRKLLESKILEKGTKITLIGDAAHPMSPFKGQGANQAMLDALSLARGIYKGCKPLSQWRETGIRKSVLTEFESEMLERSASKVKGSAEAAELLHTEIVLHEGDGPRGKHRKKKEE